MSRSSKLMGMAARIAGHEVTQQIGSRIVRSAEKLTAQTAATRFKQATVLAESLSELKGAAMKAGQLLSIDAGDLLPPEAAAALSKLQSDAEPMDFSVIREVLNSELGSEKLSQLQDLSHTAAAAASIGQVHTATVEDTKVAVKVQYPGVAESIPSDLLVLKRVAGTALRVTGRSISLDELFVELQTILELEADYQRESTCMLIYHKNLAHVPGFRAPKPFIDLSTKSVLTMEWLDGVPLGQWAGLEPTKEERSIVSKRLLDLYCKEFFEWGVVQTDPNPANFLIQENLDIGILDFGATLSYSADFRREYLELLRLLPNGSNSEIIEKGINFGVLDQRESNETKKKFVDMMRAAAQPFLPEHQPFGFRDPDYQSQARAIVFDFIQSLKFTPPPRKLAFLHRKLGGLFNILKRLDAQIDLFEYWKKMVESPWDFKDPTLS